MIPLINTDVLAYFKGMHEEAVAIIRQLTPYDLQKKCLTPNGTPITVWKWLCAMVEHEIHHRGQILSLLVDAGSTDTPVVWANVGRG